MHIYLLFFLLISLWPGVNVNVSESKINRITRGKTKILNEIMENLAKICNVKCWLAIIATNLKCRNRVNLTI